MIPASLYRIRDWHCVVCQRLVDPDGGFYVKEGGPILKVIHDGPCHWEWFKQTAAGSDVQPGLG